MTDGEAPRNDEWAGPTKGKDDLDKFRAELEQKLREREAEPELARSVLESIDVWIRFRDLHCRAASIYQKDELPADFREKCIADLTSNELQGLRWLYLAPRPTDTDYAGDDELTAPEPATKCNEGSMKDVNDCLAAEFKEADRRLNDVYGKIADRLNNDARTSLRAAQQSWLTYRDAACQASSDLQYAGSASSTLLISCKQQKTEARTEELLSIYPSLHN